MNATPQTEPSHTQATFVVYDGASGVAEVELSVPKGLIEPFIRLGQTLHRHPDALTALRELSAAVDAYHQATSTALTLEVFQRAAEELHYDAQQGTRVLMSLARFAHRNPPSLKVTCSRTSCGKHVGEGCKHCSPYWPETADMFTVGSASLAELTVSSGYDNIRGVGPAGRRVIDHLVSRS